MGLRWKEEYLDRILVPMGLLIMFGYHLFLLYRYLKFPLTTVMGCEDHYKRTWVERTLQLDAKDKGPTISVINSTISASTSLSSICLALSSLIGAWLGGSSSETHILPNSVIYGDTRESVSSIKYIAILSSFLVAFASFVQTTRNYALAAFLISIPNCEIPVSHVQKPIIRGSNYWAVGLRSLYIASSLILWIFGPIPMFVSSVIMVVILHNLDTTSSPPYQFQPQLRHHNLFQKNGEELATVTQAFGHQETSNEN